MMAFNAKNLSYDRSEPAFLRRLKGEATAGRDADRHERPVARPRGRARQPGDDEDDGPTYVLEESGDALSKAEYEALVNPGHGAAARATDATTAAAAATAADGSGPKQEDGQQAQKKPQRVASVGAASKKRKAVKIGRDDDDDDDDKRNEEEASKNASSSSAAAAGVGAVNKPNPKLASSAVKQPKPKKTKRAKAKVALSFGDDVEAAE